LPIWDFEFEQERTQTFSVRIERKRASDASRQRPIHDEIQRAQARQLVAQDFAAHDRGEMRAHAFGGDVLGEIFIVALVVSDDGDLGGVALVPGAGVRQFA
jgi:hypothetical protein